MLGGEEGLKCEVRVDGTRLKQVSELKYVGFVLDESRTDGAGVAGRWRVGVKSWLLSCPWLMVGICSLNVCCIR